MHKKPNEHGERKVNKTDEPERCERKERDHGKRVDWGTDAKSNSVGIGSDTESL